MPPQPTFSFRPVAPEVSVVIRLSESAETFREQVSSLMLQDLSTWELVLVCPDAARAAALADDVSRWTGRGVRVAATVEEVLQTCRGAYLLALDPGALLAPGHLAACCAALEANPGAQLAMADEAQFGLAYELWRPAAAPRNGYRPSGAVLFRRASWAQPPFVLPIARVREPLVLRRPGPRLPAQGAGRYLVTAIVSAFNSRRFLRGCLQDLVDQSLHTRGLLEILVVDTGSPEDEGSIVLEFQERHPHITYLRTDDRRTLYAAWNLGIAAARGKYLTNANTDDRHRPDALEKLVEELERRPEVALAYADQLVTDQANETFSQNTARQAFRWPRYSYARLRGGCMVGPQPMWRRNLHDKYGLFDPTFSAAGDWAFWLCVGRSETFAKVDDVLGLYFRNPGGLEYAHPETNRETREVIRRHGITAEDIAGASESVIIECTPTPTAPPPPQPLPGLVHAGSPPVISVVIPCYRQAQYLSAAVSSVALQTFRDLEIIVVDDGSPDETAQVFRSLAQRLPDLVLRLVQQPNQGVSSARNAGMAAARGRYVVPLDADDLIDPAFLKKTLAALTSNPGASIAFTDVYAFGAENQVRRMGPFDLEALRTCNRACSTALFELAMWRSIGGYNTGMKLGYEDWDFWISCAERGHRAVHVPEPLFFYRLKHVSRNVIAMNNHGRLCAQVAANHPHTFGGQHAQAAQWCPSRV